MRPWERTFAKSFFRMKQRRKCKLDCGISPQHTSDSEKRSEDGMRETKMILGANSVLFGGHDMETAF